MATSSPDDPGRSPEGAAPIPGRRLPRVVRQFLDTEASGGVVLLVAALAALVWANSGWRESYHDLWGADLSFRLGRFGVGGDLRHWVNDGLMTLFFFVVGLEIKRELVHGDLRDGRTAALPVVAAAGGMAVPALVFLAVNAGGPGAKGWGVPMATDIAFAVGVVALLGRRVPASLRLFLLTLAIVDDIGAIVVIAAFYARDLEPAFLLTAAALVAVIVGLRRAGMAWLPPYLLLGAGVWLATEASGVHATIAGVVLALLTPARALSPGAASPAERLEHALHPVTTFAVVPLFALANAGVAVNRAAFEGRGAAAVSAGIFLGLVVGKAAGITGAVWLAVRTGRGRLPEGSTWPMLAGIATVAGIGFTVSLLISELAFGAGPLQDAAKLGVLGASTVAALLGAVVLVLASPTAGRRP